MKHKIQDYDKENFWEVVLQDAMKGSVAQEIVELEKETSPVRLPTLEQREVEAKALKRSSKKAHPARGFSLLRVAAMIVLVIGIGAGVLMTQPTIRASVFDSIVEFFEKYLQIDFHPFEEKPHYAIGDFEVRYIPTGYWLAEQTDEEFEKGLVFRGGEYDIEIQVWPSSSWSINNDAEYAKTKSVEIGKVTGYLTDYGSKVEEHESWKRLVWEYDDHVFFLYSCLPEKELLKIAKNIYSV